MRKVLKITMALYVVFMVTVVAAFFIQHNIVYKQHIGPMGNLSSQQWSVELKGGNVEFKPLESSARMGNETEQHLHSLFWMAIATGVFTCILCAVVLKTSRAA